MALQVSVNLLLLLAVSLKTSAFNLDTTEPIVLKFDPDYVSVHRVALQNHSNSTVRLFVEAHNISGDGLRLQCFGRGYSKCAIDEGQDSTNGEAQPSWNITLSYSFDIQEYQLEVKVFRDTTDGAKVYPAWQDDDESLGKKSDRSFCAVDFNNDGNKDLALGEPLLSQRGSYEEGRVAVSVTNNQGVYGSTMLNGSGLAGARFGTSVSCIGDINLDGFQDLAVGAPGEDGGRGAIYIYHGSTSGIKHDYSQRIAAKPYKSVRGFGASVSSGVDIDQNHYLDLAVGASQSSHVVLLRTSPVMHLRCGFVPTTDITVVSSKRFVASYCISYTDRYFKTTVVARTKVTVFDQTTASQDQTISKGQVYKKTGLLITSTPRCMKVTINLKNFSRDSEDVFKPVLLKLEYELNELTSEYFCGSCPVLDPDESNESLATGYISCDHSGVCHGELREGWPNITMTEKETSTYKEDEDKVEDEIVASYNTTPVVNLALYAVGGIVCLLVAVIFLVFVCRRKRKVSDRPKTVVAACKAEFDGVTTSKNNVYYTKHPVCQMASYDDASSYPVERSINPAKCSKVLSLSCKPGYSRDASQDSDSYYEILHIRDS